MASWRRRFLAEGPWALSTRRTVPISMVAAQRAVLEGWARGEGDRPGLDLKARAVLLGADGVNCKEAARLTGAAANTVASWRKRFLAGGLESLASKAIAPVALGAARRAALEGWAQGGGGPGLARKAKALLLLADGASLSEAARRTGVAPATVFSWRMALIAGEMGAQDHPVGRADPPPPEPERAGFALAGGDRLELEGWVRDGGGKGAMAERAKIVLSGADGMDLEETARRAGVGVRAASFWWRRFSSLGLAGLRGTRARGPRFEAEVAALLSLPPPGPRRRWTALAVARVLGVGPSKARAAMLRLEPFSGKGPAAGPGASPPDGGGGD
jgi:transposase-like protein